MKRALVNIEMLFIKNADFKLLLLSFSEKLDETVNKRVV